MTDNREKLSDRPFPVDFSTRWILVGGREAEVDYDAELYHQLLDELNIGSERSLLSVIFTDYIETPDNSNPKGHYLVNEHTVLVRVFNRLGIRYMLTKKMRQKSLKTKDINDTLVHETRHFFQHVGALALGEPYEWKGRKAKRRVERDAKKFASSNKGKYPVVKTVSVNK